MPVKYGEIWLKVCRCLMCTILEMTADSNSLRDFSQYRGLIQVASEKLKVC